LPHDLTTETRGEKGAKRHAVFGEIQGEDAVGLGSFHTCAIRESGEMRCFGGNLNGQLGLGPPTSTYQESEPRRVLGAEKWGDVSGARSYTCGLTVEGELFCWGLNEDRQLGIPDVDFVNVPTRVPVEAPGGWRFLSAGQYHACAIRADRTLVLGSQQ
jgi:alpha-tubulin suppressor-like RCC1 family protein